MPKRRKNPKTGKTEALGSDGKWYEEGGFLSTGDKQLPEIARLNDDPARYVPAAQSNANNMADTVVKSTGAAGGFHAGAAIGAVIGGPIGGVVGGLVGIALGWNAGKAFVEYDPSDDEDED